MRVAFALSVVAIAEGLDCSTTLSNEVVNDNLVVPSGATCILSATQVNGNTDVESGASLTLQDGTMVGSVTVKEDASVFVLEATATGISTDEDGASVSILGGSDSSVDSVEFKGGGDLIVKGCTGSVSMEAPKGKLTVDGKGFCDGPNLATCACATPPSVSVKGGDTKQKYVLKKWLIPDPATSAEDVGVSETLIDGPNRLVINDYALGDLNLEKLTCVNSGSITVKGAGTVLQSDATFSELADCKLSVLKGAVFTSDVSFAQVPEIEIADIDIGTVGFTLIDTLTISDSFFEELAVIEVTTVLITATCVSAVLNIEKNTDVTVTGTYVVPGSSTNVKCVDNGAISGADNFVSGVNECDSAGFVGSGAATCPY